MPIVRFYVDIEIKIEEDDLPSEERRREILNEMEEVVGRRNYDLYDSGTEVQED